MVRGGLNPSLFHTNKVDDKETDGFGLSLSNRERSGDIGSFARQRGEKD